MPQDQTFATTWDPRGTQVMTGSGPAGQGGGGGYGDLFDLYRKIARWKAKNSAPQEGGPLIDLPGRGVRLISQRQAPVQEKQRFAPIYGKMVPAGLNAALNGIQWMAADASDPMASVTGYRPIP